MGVKVCLQPTSYPGRSNSWVHKGYLPELGSGSKQQEGEGMRRKWFEGSPGDMGMD